MPYSCFPKVLVGHVVNTFLWEMENREPDLPLHFHRGFFSHQVSTYRVLSGQMFSRCLKALMNKPWSGLPKQGHGQQFLGESSSADPSWSDVQLYFLSTSLWPAPQRSRLSLFPFPSGSYSELYLLKGSSALGFLA